MNEKKTREVEKALEALYNITVPVNDTGVYINIAKGHLEKAIAPKQPEIPEGCPVIITCDDGYKINGHMGDPSCGGAASIEIDYQRKGAVIPWGGGECPVDEETRVTTYHRDGDIGSCKAGMYTSWAHKDHESDIIAFCVWPEWVK